jgi:PAS domain S-box-containing protein
MMSEQQITQNQRTMHSTKSLIQPEAISLNALLDISRITKATESVAHATDATVGVLTLDDVDPENGVLNISRNGMTGEIDKKCLERHRNAALEAIAYVQPVVVDQSVDVTLHCIPIYLRHADINYPKAIITVEPNHVDQLEFTLDMLGHLAESFSQEITALYSAYVSDYRLNETEVNLREENNRLRLFLEHVGGALAVLDSNCRITWTNNESTRYFNADDDVIGKHCSQVLNNTDEICSHCTILRAFASGRVETRIVGRPTKNGDTYYYKATATPIHDASGNVVQVMFMGNDVTELCRVEKELQKRTEMLEMQHRKIVEATRQKSQFFASVSHDLRTPLTSILGFTDILLEEGDEPLSSNQRHMLQKVKQSAERLLRLINDIMDISKLESGRMTTNITRVNLSLLISQVVEAMVPLVRDRDVQLIADAPDNLPVVSTDDQKLSQILVNLISNAIKFTPSGSVTVKAESFVDKIRIAVTDTGIGIRKADFGKIFEEFTQLEWSGARREGTGLGLAITKRLVQLLGGDIYVESKVREGSSFIVTLPISLNGSISTHRQTVGRVLRSKYKD